MKWLPIDDNVPVGKEMFVVIAKDVYPTHSCEFLYTSDPYCVWRDYDGTYNRWPHEFQPTHYCLLPN